MAVTDIEIGAGLPARDPARTIVQRVGPGTVRRELTVRPGMCGHNSLLVGQVGDWTWETVSELCGIDVFAARLDDGRPTYLSFYYIHLLGSPGLHPLSLTFGERIEVLSRSFDFGSESILTVHRIRLLGLGAVAERELDPSQIYEHPRPDCLYVETFNRWVSRGHGDSNVGLVRASPPGFRHDHLPALPGCFSPRPIYGRARSAGTFVAATAPGLGPASAPTVTDFPVDITRDINGAGLLYFAAYFSIVDRGLLEHWRCRGRTDAEFLSRTVLDHKLCYLGNSDPGTVLRLTAASRPHEGIPTDETTTVRVAERDCGRLIAVATVHTRNTLAGPTSEPPTRGLRLQESR